MFSCLILSSGNVLMRYYFIYFCVKKGKKPRRKYIFGFIILEKQNIHFASLHALACFSFFISFVFFLYFLYFLLQLDCVVHFGFFFCLFICYFLKQAQTILLWMLLLAFRKFQSKSFSLLWLKKRGTTNQGLCMSKS